MYIKKVNSFTFFWLLAVSSREDENENEDENYHPDGL